MTKMAAKPIYGKKNFKKSSQPNGRDHWNLVYNIGVSSTTKFAQMMTLVDPFTQKSALIPYAFV